MMLSYYNYDPSDTSSAAGASSGLYFSESGVWPDLEELQSAMAPLRRLSQRRQKQRKRQKRKREEEEEEEKEREKRASSSSFGRVSCARDSGEEEEPDRIEKVDDEEEDRVSEKMMLWCGAQRQSGLESSAAAAGEQRKGGRRRKKKTVTDAPKVKAVAPAGKGAVAAAAAESERRKNRNWRRKNMMLPWNRKKEDSDEEDENDSAAMMEGIEVHPDQVNEADRSSSRLHKILNSGGEEAKSAKTEGLARTITCKTSFKSEKQQPLSTTFLSKSSASASPSPSDDIPSASKPPENFFVRGSHLVKSSLRRIGVLARLQQDGVGEAGLKVKGASASTELNRPLKKKAALGGSSEDETGFCNSSQDSGLGEDSDFDLALRGSSVLSTSPRSPTPGGISSVILRPSTSSLRKISSASSNSNGAPHVSAIKKHVMIREPNLIELPSSKRLLREIGPVKRVEKVKILDSRKNNVRRAQNMPNHGNVASQWVRLYEAARADVVACVPGCDGMTVALIFEADAALVRRGVEDFVDIASLVHTVYKILSYDWLGKGSKKKSNLAIIIHCVQMFIVIVVDVALEEYEEEDICLRNKTRELVLKCQDTRYNNLENCLETTRGVYVDLWCALMEVKRT